MFVACLVRVNSEAVPQHQENTEASTGNENSVTEVTTSTIIGTTVSTEAEVKLENSTPLNNVGAINQMLENENKATAIAEVFILERDDVDVSEIKIFCCKLKWFVVFFCYNYLE